MRRDFVSSIEQFFISAIAIMRRATRAVDPVPIDKPASYFSTAHCAPDIGCARLFGPVVIFAMGNSSFECEYRAPSGAPRCCVGWARRTLTILLFYVYTGPWTRLKVSQQSGGRGTWFKTGTISRGIALRRLTSAACTRARSVCPFSFSLSLFLPLPPSPDVFKNATAQNVGRRTLRAPLWFPSWCKNASFAFCNLSRCIAVNEITDVRVALYV